MDPEQLKTHINAALEPLIQRIKALEDENQEIKALLKNIPQPKAPVKPAPNTTTGNTTSTISIYKGVKKIPPPTKGHEGEKKGGQKKEGAKVEEEKKLEHNQHAEGHPEQAQGEGKTQTTPANQKKCNDFIILEPATKPATVGNNKKPNIQPDPKKPGQTPHADKKTPGTTGRVSVGADKKGPGKVKTEGQKHEHKQEQNGETHGEHKQPTTVTKDEKSKQKKAPVKTGAHDKPAHGKPATDHKNQKDKPPTGVKPKPGATKEPHVTNSSSKKNLVTGVKKTEGSPKQEKVEAVEKSEPVPEVVVSEQKKQAEPQTKTQVVAEEPPKQQVVAATAETTETTATVATEQVSKSDELKAESAPEPVAQPQEQTA